MVQFFRRWWRLLAAAGLLAAALQLFLRPPSELHAADPARNGGAALFRPVYTAVDVLRRGVTGAWFRYVALVGVSRENERLRKEVEELRRKLEENREALLENRRLKELLRFSETVEKPTIGARVVGRDISPWFQAVFIDAGSEAGVEPGMAVVTPSGGVGRIEKVSRGLSAVLLATDGRFAADVIVERSRVRAIAEGAGGGFCRLKYVSPTHDVAVGDRVLFSGFDGSMPKGALLGTITAVERPREGLFQKVRVACAVNFTAMEEVLVVLSRPSIPFEAARE